MQKDYKKVVDIKKANNRIVNNQSRVAREGRAAHLFLCI